ncbi:DUF5592 family protein [uncultured Merdimonas sp.]|uniref:DUF5592 family protein n=1 Tax=uncultured Merdimonas sp. TaxID=2023269 RepID=UPI00320AC057
MLSNAVHASLVVPFLIFSLAVAFCLTMKSQGNRRRRNYESICIYFRRDDEVYRPVINISKARERQGSGDDKEDAFYEYM